MFNCKGKQTSYYVGEYHILQGTCRELEVTLQKRLLACSIDVNGMSSSVSSDRFNWRKALRFRVTGSPNRALNSFRRCTVSSFQVDCNVPHRPREDEDTGVASSQHRTS